MIAELAPGYAVLAHLSRTRRLDTYEVWSLERACSCVAKVLRPDRRDDDRARAALIAEGELLCSLAHPHLVRGYEVLEGPVVIMETLDGETLAHLVDRSPGGLDTEEVAWLGLHLAAALHYLHGRGVLHLDVKASNVIADGGRAKLIDLSLARPPGRYRPGVGTWCNLAPEQADGRELGPAADVWGLGTVLFEAAAGEPAFGEADGSGSWTEDSAPSDTWHTEEQLAAGYPQLAGRAPACGGPLGEAVDACLEPEPGDRPSRVELASMLVPHAPGARPWAD